MSLRAIGIYREPEFSPGKVEADAAILDAAVAELASEGIETVTLDAADFAAAGAPHAADLVLAMCQGANALKRLAEVEQAGAAAINPALAIRNCYRDLLAPGLARAGVPTPAGALVETGEPFDARAMAGVDLSAAVFVKRGDLHALAADDVQRAAGRAEIEGKLRALARRGIQRAFVQQECEGRVIKFYGVSGTGYFSALADDGEIPEAAIRDLSEAAEKAASALGLEAWGGDAILSGDRFAVIDFNDWPSYSRVRGQAARAIARRALQLLKSPR
jgi:glutathione synthase/RimK-type ligase-like ATP-grasp enzyme